MYQSYSRQAFSRTANTTLVNYIREVEETMLRRVQLLALLEANGRIIYNDSGDSIDWPVQYKLHDLEGNTGQTTRTFSTNNLWTHAQTDWRGYQATDMMYEREFLANRGEEGVIKVFDGMTERLGTSLRQGLGRQFFQNGSAVQNIEFWEGFETLFQMAATPQTVTYTSGVPRTANQDDYVAYPEGNYANLPITLGAQGGDNQQGMYWPDGLADPEYDFWTPLVVLYNSNRFSGTAKTFKEQGEEAMRYAILNQQRNGDLEDQLTTFWLGRDIYGELLAKQDNRQEIQVEPTYTVRALGFKSIMFDGVECTTEASVPYGRGYGMALMNVQLRSMYGELLHTEGPVWDMEDQSYKAVVATLSNLKYKSPRNFVKLAKHDNLAV